MDARELTDTLLNSIEATLETLAKSRVDGKLDRLTIDAVLDNCRNTLNLLQQNRTLTFQDTPVGYLVCSTTGLRVPPLPRTPFKDRASKYGSKISVEDFLGREWGDYLTARLLYSDHIREFDYSLYRALVYRAGVDDLGLPELARKLGILTFDDVVNPNPGPDVLPQTRLINELRLRRLSHGVMRSAAALASQRTD